MHIKDKNRSETGLQKLYSPAVRFVKRNVVILLAVIPCFIFLFYINTFSFFYIYASNTFKITDSMIENCTLRLGDWTRKKEVGSEIALIAIEDKNFDFTWREKHAELVKKLSEVGARVIVFDLFFEKKREGYDEKFIHVIKQARKLGTAVIFAIRNFDGNEPVIAQEYKDVISGYGLACVAVTPGDRIQAPMVIKRENRPDFHSLSLKAFESYQGGNIIHADTEEVIIEMSDGERIKYKGPYRRNIEQLHLGCEAVRPGDNIIEAMIAQSPLEKFREPGRRFVYDEVIGILSPEKLVEHFNSKIVLIGIQNRNSDIHECAAGECHGMELHACAINTVLRHAYVKPTPRWLDLLLICCGVITGVLSILLNKHKIMAKRRWILLFFFCFIIQVVLYRFVDILTNSPVYAATSLLLTHFAGKIYTERKKS